ncbi:hypothetical protein [Actinoplanes palleronii]|uniref:Uncharacterized protein n=1 Tax=Actinoplanes palleronii TaxID=113570 RepID=A0ABQ4BJA4_9ACTN|nr:hypothetical protein [Actinoplanes palleronii]GIE70761.1 hypothetical protein Apa02nite_068690 [Actinoplanes palleronii]
MASLTKLHRRLLRWERYDDHLRKLALANTEWYDICSPRGLSRARDRWLAERYRHRVIASQRYALADLRGQAWIDAVKDAWLPDGGERRD